MGTEVVSTDDVSAKASNAQDRKEFIQDYISSLFDEKEGFSHEDCAKFGELMKGDDDRLFFAKCIDARRGVSRCLGEITFYKLLHSFALVLFECSEADYFEPGKILMNMAFTYYHIPHAKYAALEQTLQKMASTGPDQKSENTSKLKQRKNYAGKMVKNLEKTLVSCVEALKDYDIAVDLKDEKGKRKKFSKNSHKEVTSKEKYLYEYLKNQPIWKSERFWEESFFTAVASERGRRCSLRAWSKLSLEERKGFEDMLANITFGQLGTFINNMICLGVPKPAVQEFLRKHAVIGGIEIGGELYKMLDHLIDNGK